MVTIGTMALLTAVLAAPPPASGPHSGPHGRVSWENDVRPALEAGVCLEALRADPSTSALPCADATAVAPELAGLAWLMAERMELVVRMPSLRQPRQPAGSTPPEGPPNLGAPMKALRPTVLGDPRIVAALMPEVRAELERRGLTCDGCPDPAGPARSFRLAELKPYLGAFAWPQAIRPDGSVALLVCVGGNGLARLEDVDPQLADAAVLAIMGNVAASPRFGPLVKRAKQSTAFQVAASDEERLEALRAALMPLLQTDAEFLAAVEAQAADVLPRVGMLCTDCRAAVSVPPP